MSVGHKTLCFPFFNSYSKVSVIISSNLLVDLTAKQASQYKILQEKFDSYNGEF